MIFSPFGKILALGHRLIRDIFEDGEIEITEKVDGSQFGFGKLWGEVGCRSRGRMISMDQPDQMFQQAVAQVQRISEIIPDNTKFYGEYLKKPKHNVIEYGTYPKNHITLFGMEKSADATWEYTRADLEYWADKFGFDIVPMLFQGKLEEGMSIAFLEQLLDTDSYLGASKIEGFVIKNWHKEVSLPAGPSWPMSAKFVSEKFKEKMGQGGKGTKPGAWSTLKSQYQSEARWQKGIQHMIEDGTLLGEPKDIGPLLKTINQDIISECKEEIMHELWACFHKELLKTATLGFPEYYKLQLAKGEINVGS